MPSPVRPLVRLGSDCDGACVFCVQEGAAALAFDADRVRQELASLRGAGHDEVTLGGGEPTRFEAWAAVVAEARALGFVRVGVQTHGGALWERPALEAAIAAGLTDVHLSLHGSSAPVHEYLTGVAGSFGRCVATASAARARGLDVAVLTVLTRSNQRDLPDLARLLASLHVSAWLVQVPHVAGRAFDAHERIPPRLAMALPHALMALDTARKTGLPAAIRGAPLCMLGPFASVSLREGTPREFVERCGRCVARERCDGVDAWYASRFSGDELRPLQELPKGQRLPDVFRMFAEPGPLGRRETAPTAQGAARPLPVLQ